MRKEQREHGMIVVVHNEPTRQLYFEKPVDSGYRVTQSFEASAPDRTVFRRYYALFQSLIPP